MDAGLGYDMSNLHALQQELRRLNIAAIEARVIRPLNGGPERSSSKVPSQATPARSPRNGKAGAKRMLTMLRRLEGDDSPVVVGTDFTEAGVVRLLAHLRNPGNRTPPRYLNRLRRYLARPVQFGFRVSAGISVERLQWVSRYLNDIEAYGLDHVQKVNAARREQKFPPPPSTKPRSPDLKRTGTASQTSHAQTSERAENK